jgi:hypothetical protein
LSETDKIKALPGFLQPRLRLFLSVDVVNSTAFKQSQAIERKQNKGEDQELAEPWFSPITTFYRQIERLFSIHWKNLSSEVSSRFSWPAGAAPELWKAAGDELLYVKEISDYRQSLVTVQAWIEAINRHRIELKIQYPMLDLKATAWLAGFPVNNAEVILRPSIETSDDDLAEGDPILSNLMLLRIHSDNPGQRSFRDFIGPSIDTGFRVAQLATSRKMAITVDLALMLAHATVNQPNEEDFPFEKLNFHYEGRVPLKGVLDGAAYPFFWIDIADTDPLIVIEDRISKVESIGANEVKEFCERFIAKSGRAITKPFIVDSEEPLFRTVPQYHLSRLTRLSEYWKNESEYRRTEQDALNSDTPPDDGATESLEDAESKILASHMVQSSTKHIESGQKITAKNKDN